MNSRSFTRAALAVVPLFASLSLAQTPEVKIPRVLPPQADFKTAPTVDSVKGRGQVLPFTDADRARERVARKGEAAGPLATAMLRTGPTAVGERVLYDSGTDGRLWASGATFKASFGRDGFVYVPFFGARAARNHPVHFTLAAVRVAGQPVAFDADVQPTRSGDRVVFDRGIVREVYDLTLRGIEQTFVVDGVAPGDVTIDLEVTSDLQEDAARPGLQFANELGCVEYGTAFVVDGGDKEEIATAFADGRIRLSVTAAQRPAGALVIDPVISTGFTSTTSSYDFDRPDVSFDATTGRYLLVWERHFSAADVDVLAEMRDASGNFLPGSGMIIDSSTDHWSLPRVANLNAYDRFLVVAEKFVAANPVGQRSTIWGRTIEATSPTTVGAAFEVSGNQGGDKRAPDVGGDPSLATPTYWTVVYTRELSATDHDIHGRQVGSTGLPRQNTLFLENSADTIYRDAQISHSNGDIGASSQRWAVVFSYRFNSTDWDVYGATLAWDGVITKPAAPLDTSTTSHVAPSVSSLAHAFPGGPTFGVTYEVASGAQDLRAMVVTPAFATIVPPTNLSVLLGDQGAIDSRIETDGVRFVVAYAPGQPAVAATLGVLGSSFVVHEAPQQLGNVHNAWDLNIVSRAAAGGSNTGYGIVFSDTNPNPDRIVFATYLGHGQGGVSTRPTGCGGLGIVGTGSPFLGRSFSAVLTGIGSDLVGLLVGLPGPALAVCGTCRLGIAMNGPMLNVPNLSVLVLEVPTLHTLVGGTLSMQGYAVGTSTCLGLVRLGDTLDVTIQ